MTKLEPLDLLAVSKSLFNIADEYTTENTAMKRLLLEVSKRLRGGKLPDDYLVFDSETNGLSVTCNNILQYAVAFVRSRKPAGTVRCYVKHPTTVYISQDAINVNHITHDILQAKGENPKDAFGALAETFNDAQSKGKAIVGHNLMAFDIPLIQKEFLEHNITFRFDDSNIIDTGMLEKASQLGCYFTSDDTLASFYARVYKLFAKGVYWSLAKHCFKKYNLAKYGLSADNMHDAGDDCLATHLVLEEQRKLIEA